MAYSIHWAVKDVLHLGEGPHWDADTQSLYFVDVMSCTIHKYKPSTNEHTKTSIGRSPSFIIPIAGTNNKFLVGVLKDLVVITWDGISDTMSETEKIAEIDDIESLKDNRMNDAKVDFVGRLWTGSLDSKSGLIEGFPAVGRLISFNKNRQIKYHIDGIKTSNGFAFNKDLKKVYYIDSVEKAIDEFDYDAENEEISNRKSIFSLEKHDIGGYPDGQTIDTDGNLWVAIFNDSKIIKIDPRIPETLLQVVEMPAKMVTSVAFGGEHLDELYVTSARDVYFPDAPRSSADGVVYKITGLGVKGFPGVPFKLED